MIKTISVNELEAAIQATSALVSPAVNAKKVRPNNSTQGESAANGGFPEGNAAILFDPEIGCGFMRYIKNEAASLSEPAWRIGLSIIATCANAGELAQAISAPYEGYSAKETAAKLEQVRNNKYGPHTCQYIRDNVGDCCAGCPHNLKSPAVLASQPKYGRLLEAKEVIFKALASVEGGDKSAHLAPDVLQSFAVAKKLLLAKFSEWREILKAQKAPLPDFDKAVAKELKEGSEVDFPAPTEPIYANIVKRLEGTPYHMNERGHLCCTDNDGNEQRIASFVVEPLKQICRDDGQTCENRFEVRGIAAGGEELSTIVVSEAELTNLRFCVQHWGFRAKIEVGANNVFRLRDSIFELGRNTSVETIFTHSGWRKIDGNWAYLHGNGAIGAKGVRVELSDTLRDCRLPKPPVSPQKAILACLKLRFVAPPRVMLPLLATALLALLCEPARRAGIEPEFVLWLSGRTGSRKTTLALLVSQLFGNFSRPPASFKDTMNALGQKSFLFKDALLLIDDFHPAGSAKEVQSMINLAAYALRLYGDRIGKGRLNAKIELQETRPPRGVAVITAEDSPPGSESSVARTFVSTIGSDDVDLAKLTAAQNNQALLAKCMAAYIKWLIPRMDTLPEELADNFQKLRSYYQQKALHGRTSEAAAWLTIAWEKFLEFAQDSSAIDTAKASQLGKIGRKTFAKLVEEQAQLVQAQQPAAIFLSVFAEMLSAGKMSVLNIAPNVQRLGAPDHTFVGYKDTEYFYLYPETVFNKVNSFLQSRNQRIGISPKALWERLADEDHIAVEMENIGTSRERRLHTKKKKVDAGKDRVRLLWLKRASIEGSDSGSDN